MSNIKAMQMFHDAFARTAEFVTSANLAQRAKTTGSSRDDAEKWLRELFNQSMMLHGVPGCEEFKPQVRAFVESELHRVYGAKRPLKVA